jgi:adenine-specific DNA-methyltransferase
MILDARRRLGQWSTPAAVADLAVALAGPLAGARVLDPACGDGAILGRAARRGPGALVGVEIDAEAVAAARRAVPAADVRCGDLLDDAVAAAVGEVDVVIGNPPYVRHGLAGRVDKERRARAVAIDWPAVPVDDADAIGRRGDLAATVLLRALRRVRAGGRLVCVVSSALLDADAADPLWRAVTAAGAVRAIVAAPAERWFGTAAVNAMIVVIDRTPAPAPAPVAADALPPAHAERSERSERSRSAAPPHAPGHGAGTIVARLTVDTAIAADRLLAGATLADVAETRLVPDAGDGRARAWATALRAPAAWHAFVDAAGAALVPLAELATIRRGATTGGNRFFYLRRADAAARGIEPAVLAPVVRSPYNGAPAAIALDPGATPIVAVTAPADADLRTLPGLAAWIRANAALAARPSLARVPHPWWHLPARPARLFLAKAYGPRFVQRLAPEPMLADQRVYALEPRPGVDLLALAAVVNATPTALALEALGRASMGHGAVEHTARDLAALPVLDVRNADESTRARLAAALAAIAPREIRHVADERGRADRDEIDAAALSLAPPAAAALGPSLWDALLASVRLRDRWLLPAV